MTEQSTNNEIKYITDTLVELKSDLKDIKKDTSEIKTDVAVLKANQENMKEQLSKIDGTQKAQIWSLITLVLATIGTLTVALFKMK